LKIFENILKKYWGYTKFRPLQLDIIRSVHSGLDTLGLMPTGGGKSITFQIAGLAKEGICIVVTPLIALMKDQVDSLRQKGIKAIAIYSGMNYKEIEIAYDNCTYGNVKFLYISPERLKTDMFRERIRNMNVNLLTIDEAHCISQWGYDIRPSYLEIIEIRNVIPTVPVLALTATATPDVIADIQNKLGFKRHNVLQTSFERKNLTYIVKQKEDKLGYILTICKKIRGAGIVYVKTRKQTKEIALALREMGVNTDFYHAGLDAQTRNLKQENWMKSHNMVMISTNAFGMGIDKPNVRFVLHFDMPESLEAYFQEAGRAGRDGLEAFAVLLYNKKDISNLKANFTKKFPDFKYIKNVYEALANYYQIEVGAAKGNVYDFFIDDFCKTFKFEIVKTYNSIKILEDEGYIVLSEAAETKSRVKFKLQRDDLYKFQVEHRQFDAFIKLLLRSYTGIFTEFCIISEEQLAKKVNAETDLIIKYLIALAKLGIISYYRAKQNPLIIYTEERLPTESLLFSYNDIETRKQKHEQRLQAIIEYVTNHSKCRSLQLLEYFGESNKMRCGNCDVCRKRNEIGVNTITFDYIVSDLKRIIGKKPASLHEIISQVSHSEQDVISVINYLLDHKKISYTGGSELLWNT
jgi:ATP-dependent DNA helicase RecQ